MSKKKINLRGIVLTWTILTTTFFWTSTMRLLLKPEISNWRIFDFGGKGTIGQFWLLPLIVLAALFLFYIEGRGKLRLLYHTLLLGWHLSITAILAYGGIQSGSQATFAAWGVTISFAWLALPLAFFAILAILLVIQETRGYLPVSVFGWNQINWSKLGFAGLLLPVAFAFFWMGEGYNLMVKIAIIVTIIQWILLAEALGRQHSVTTTKH